MSLAKSLPTRSVIRSRVVRNPRQSLQRPNWQRTSRRGYATAGEKAKETAGKASAAMKSDLPWLLGSIAVTVPSTYFILANGSGKHDGGHGGEEHEEPEEENEEDSAAQEDSDGKEGNDDEDAAGGKENAEGDGDEAEGGEDGKTEEGEEEHKEGDEDAKGGQDGDPRVMAGKKPEAGDVKPRDGQQKQEGGNEEVTGDGENSEDGKGEEKAAVDKTQSSDGKGRQTSSKEGRAVGKQVQEQPKDNSLSKKTASGEPGKFDEEVELENDSKSKTIHKPDAKGGAKRRIESGNAIKLGEADEDDSGDGNDKAAASKTPVKGQMSGKQAGLSNTDTKHSTDPMNDPDKSKKSEGAPETAKLQGTVDPGRKLV